MEALSRWHRSLRSDVAIDLGTVNTLVYTAIHGLVIDEPSVVVRHRLTRDLLAVGRPADALLGRAPRDVEVIRPLHDGVISDLDACTLMLRGFLRRAVRPYRLARSAAVVCVPGGATDIERWALVDATRSGSAHLHVSLVDEAVAAAVGSGIAPGDAAPVLVADIGGGTTELAIVVDGGPVRSRSIRVGGNKMDSAIVQAVRAEYGLVIGERAAERLKMEIGLEGSGDPVAVTGIDPARLGRLRTSEVVAKVVADALERPLGAILGALMDLVGETPPDLAQEVLQGGIRLAGGGALLPGVAPRIAAHTGFPALVAPDPLQCVVRGLANILERGAQPRNVA